MQGAKPLAIAYVLLCLVFAYYAAKWNRGVLPVAAGMAVLFGVIALVAAPGWFERDKAGFSTSMLDPSLLGLLTVLVIPMQLVLVLVLSIAFRQEWNVEIEAAEGSNGGPPPRTGGTPDPVGA